MQKGSVLEGTVVLVTLFIIIFLFMLPNNSKGPLRPIVPLGGQISNTDPSYTTISTERPQTSSSYANSVSIGTGNAAYSIQPYEEYITITNVGTNSVNITGWKLVNGRSNRVASDGSGRTYQNDVAIIPGASTGNIILKPGEQAVITTGNVTNQSPYRITSFKENICSGYLEASGDYTFTPSLRRSCVRPDSEVGYTSLDNKCRDFVSGLYGCHIPELNTRDASGDICTTCADGVQLSSSCVAFIKTHYNYASCVSNHGLDPNFYQNTWRVFLGRSWEMWADKYESISLYDQFGKLAAYVSY